MKYLHILFYQGRFQTRHYIAVGCHCFPFEM
jgi:hypothetical protein